MGGQDYSSLTYTEQEAFDKYRDEFNLHVQQF